MNDLIGLGRLISKDDRDQKHLLPRRAAQAAGVETRHWYLPPSIDQGPTSSCVGHGWAHKILAGPVTNKLPISPFDLYRQCQDVDEWPGSESDPPQYEGSSVRAGAKVLQRMGLIGGYKWAPNATVAFEHVLTTSPVVVGTSWHEGMANPDQKTGLMTLTGGNLGGHCYLIGGATRQRGGMFRILNSYGRGWAKNGRAWISVKDMDVLIKDDGEACVDLEVKQGSVRPAGGQTDYRTDHSGR